MIARTLEPHTLESHTLNRTWTHVSIRTLAAAHSHHVVAGFLPRPKSCSWDLKEMNLWAGSHSSEPD